MSLPKFNNLFMGSVMRRIIALFAVILLSQQMVFPQVKANQWTTTFGAIIPRYIGSEVNGTEINYGLFASAQYNFSEHSDFRWGAHYAMIRSFSSPVKNNTLSINLDYIYHLAPCDILNPYLGIGVSGLYFSMEKGKDVKNDSYLDYQANIIFGVNWGIIDEYLTEILGEGFSYNTEIAYHTVATDKYDGTYGNVGGLLGGSLDTYMTFKAGFIYRITEGKKYKYCDLYDGIINLTVNADQNQDKKDGDPNTTVSNGLVDYNRIEDIVKRYVKEPANIDYNRIEDIVKRNKPSINFDGMPTNDKNATDGYAPNWVLMGINFEFNSTRFTPESYPILLNAFQILMANPSLRVEIQGHTDNIGSSEVNRKLSRDRADLVKQYLVSKGIAANRLSTSGFGAEKPIADNQTSMGRFLNRRIEFKVLGK
ncbi:MAG: hypothetical protein FMNOHCHN_01405 [Ignavibacteriaceae bacterium]|nr:hypothetical protein [Ignavibacteriaceae bacterium]